MAEHLPPGAVRDAIFAFFAELGDADASTGDIVAGVEQRLGRQVATSSVRSYLRLNPDRFSRVSRGRYRMVGRK
jgi:hypothetical protein